MVFGTGDMTLLVIVGIELNLGLPAGWKIDQILVHMRNQECKVIGVTRHE
jgi:hypothetical protein